jgi:hypothetical protein
VPFEFPERDNSRIPGSGRIRKIAIALSGFRVSAILGMGLTTLVGFLVPASAEEVVAFKSGDRALQGCCTSRTGQVLVLSGSAMPLEASAPSFAYPVFVATLFGWAWWCRNAPRD